MPYCESKLRFRNFCLTLLSSSAYCLQLVADYLQFDFFKKSISRQFYTTEPYRFTNMMSKVLISKYLYTHLNLDFFICETLYSQKLSLLRDILARILDHIISFISTCGRSALWLSWHFFQQFNQKKLGIHTICQYKNQVQCTNSIAF